MRVLTTYTPIHAGTRRLSEILADEQALFAAKAMASLRVNPNLSREELAFASKEDRMGAALLRMVINQMDAVVGDSEVTIMRVIVSNDLLLKLELWGAFNEDVEPGHDVEQIEFSFTCAE